ncbi:MAG: hypothetical protein ACRC33_10375 [Gemmataceae bacterium]
MRFATPLLLTLAVAVAGCGKKKDPEPDPAKAAGVQPGAANPHVEFRPTGGSTTLAGKMRDRALDARMMDEMRQVKLGLDADGIGVPANKAAWITWLRDYKTLRGLLEKDELVAFSNVRLGDAGTVLMYEKRILTDPDAIVLTADGQPHRMTKAAFDLLKKPQ